MGAKLQGLTLYGYKSFPGIPEGAGTDARPPGCRVAFAPDVTVLIGANGAGKSNLVSFFKMLGYLGSNALQEYVETHGRARGLLHFGPAVTRKVEARLQFEDLGHTDWYTLPLGFGEPDNLVVLNEVIEWQAQGRTRPFHHSYPLGGRESYLPQAAQGADNAAKPAQVVLDLLRGCKAFQFHDTSPTATLRLSSYVQDCKYLKHNAGNLAAYLYFLKTQYEAYFTRIINTVRLVCPQLHDLEPEPSPFNLAEVTLNWRDKSQPDCLLGPHQLSDGTLRFIALATLFLQPKEKLPPVVVVDEPELGLHPNAIGILSGLAQSAGVHSQVILATQSPTLVSHFELRQIRPVEYHGGASRVLDLAPEEYEHWLEDFTTGELMEKNVLGGGPSHE
jgi:predicted ATPase